MSGNMKESFAVVDGATMEVEHRDNQNLNVGNRKKRKLARSIDSSSSVLEESRRKKMRKEFKSKENETLQGNSDERIENNDGKHGEDHIFIVDNDTVRKKLSRSMDLRSSISGSSKSNFFLKKSKSKDNETSQDRVNEKLSENIDCEHGEGRDFKVDHSNKEMKLASSLDPTSLLWEVSTSKRKKKRSKSKANKMLQNNANARALEDDDGRHGGSRNFSADDNDMKIKLVNSLDLSSSVCEASRNKKKGKKSKSKARETLQDNLNEKVSKNNEGDSRPSSLRADENLKTIRPRPNKKTKVVSFSDYDEVFPIANNASHSRNHGKMVVGKRYTKEEDQILKDAIYKFLAERGLGKDDAYMLFCVKEHPEVRNCWKEIHAAMPWRTRGSVNVRAENLFLEGPKGKWTNEEIELVKRYRAEHGKGSHWKTLSELLGRNRLHIKDAWRRNRLPNEKKGSWSQEEYQRLFDLVNMDLRMKASEDKDFRNSMLKDNLSWTAISDSLATRHHAVCCQKWYYQLASPMVNQGLWSDCDDYLLLNALSKLDASCVEDVDWDNLVENRSGDVCHMRWKEMTKHIGGKKERPFMEQVELLSTRYCEDMLQYRTGAVKTE